MRALRYRKRIPGYLAVRALGRHFPGIATSSLSPLELARIEPEELPRPDWLRVRTRLSGICGSDLATVFCHGSFYFSALTSFPFVPGHEVVGDIVELGAQARGFSPGERVIVEPALGCRVRGLAPPCAACAAGNQGNCTRLAEGSIAPGVQTGYCASTGGGWGESFVAHVSQVHRVPESLSDEDAVLIEPFACAIHAVLAAQLPDAARALVLGAGSLGLLTLLALKRLRPGVEVWIAAKHPHQAEAAARLGADRVLPAGAALREAVIERTGAARHQPDLGPPMVLGGVDAAFDCIGQSRTLDEAIRLTRARGTVVVVGMPARLCGIEGTALWFKETRLLGAYAYGVEAAGSRTFDIALAEAARVPGTLAALVTGRHRIERYRRAIQEAAATGAAGSIKTVFDWR